MPHEIESIAYNKTEKPWHRLGVPVDADMTPTDMMIAASLDWQVGKFDNFALVPSPTDDNPTRKVQVPTGKQSLIRLSDSKLLEANVGRDWEPVQNIEAFEFFDSFVKAGDMTMETAGSLKGGTIVWALAKLKSGFNLFNGDEIEGHMLFSNYHKYGNSTQVDFTPIRVVCWNTLTLAMKTKSGHQARVPHRTKFDADKVKIAMGIVGERLDQYKEECAFLGSVKAEKLDVVEYFKEIFKVNSRGEKKTTGPKKEMNKHAVECLKLLEVQPGREFAPGTWWQAFNAVTYNVDHLMCKTEDQRITEAWFGAQKETKIKAFDLALKLAREHA